MYRRTFRERLCALFLCAILSVTCLFAQANAADEQYSDILFDNNEIERELVATISDEFHIELWHYSGNYWGNTTLGIKIMDKNVFDNVERLAELVNQYVQFNLSIPEAVKSKMSNSDIRALIGSIGNVKLSDYFSKNAGKIQYQISDKVYIRAFPKYNIAENLSYFEYIEDSPQKTIPLVDKKYGYNVYSIFSKSGQHLGMARGYLDADNPMDTGSGKTIHPSQIENSTGKLKSGFEVDVIDSSGASKTYKSEDIRIGNGTFNNAGAVGIHFVYPVKISFYAVPKADENDVTAKISGSYAAYPGTPVTVTVNVTNQSEQEQSFPVAFTAGNFSERKNVTLNAGANQNLLFTLTAAASDTAMTAFADPDNSIAESNEDNNKDTSILKIITEIQTSGSDCENGTIEWSETHPHEIFYYCSGCVCGKKSCYCPGHRETCSHIHRYTAKITVDPIITGIDGANTHQLKSGYGFSFTSRCRIEVTRKGNSGKCRYISGIRSGKVTQTEQYQETLTPPDKVYYYAPSSVSPPNVTNTRGTQLYKLLLSNDTLKKGPLNEPMGTYSPQANPVSEIYSKKIYTDVSWKDGRHFFTLQYTGGGIAGQKWCYTRSGNISNGQYIDIKGNMYEDDFTGSR